MDSWMTTDGDEWFVPAEKGDGRPVRESSSHKTVPFTHRHAVNPVSVLILHPINRDTRYKLCGHYLRHWRKRNTFTFLGVVRVFFAFLFCVVFS